MKMAEKQAPVLHMARTWTRSAYNKAKNARKEAYEEAQKKEHKEPVKYTLGEIRPASSEKPTVYDAKGNVMMETDTETDPEITTKFSWIAGVRKPNLGKVGHTQEDHVTHAIGYVHPPGASSSSWNPVPELAPPPPKSSGSQMAEAEPTAAAVEEEVAKEEAEKPSEKTGFDGKVWEALEGSAKQDASVQELKGIIEGDSGSQKTETATKEATTGE